LVGLLGIGGALIALSSVSKDEEPRQATSASGVVQVEVTERGFTPSSITLSPGLPTELQFLRTTEETCASSVVFPELGVSEPLALNSPVRVKVPAMGPRTLSFQCGVGDHRSAVIIN
jgi:plastocyanin domain-containing protein